MAEATPPAEHARAPAQVPAQAAKVLAFWLAPAMDAKAWFFGGPELDEAIRSRFGDLIAEAQAGRLAAWEQTPEGALALLIVCDQFTRNLYRKQAKAFALDGYALGVAARAHARGFDQHIKPEHRGFFYLPFEHDESLVSQVASVALFEVLRRDAKGTAAQAWCQSQYEYAVRHRDAIVRFGRFAARNEALGRKSTSEELAYLREHAQGF